MSNKKDGGSAFPFSETFQDDHGNVEVKYTNEGMTLRDYFAGQALSNLIMTGVRGGANHIALQAYEIADAMLKSREKRDE